MLVLLTSEEIGRRQMLKTEFRRKIRDVIGSPFHQAVERMQCTCGEPCLWAATGRKLTPPWESGKGINQKKVPENENLLRTRSLGQGYSSSQIWRRE